MEESLNGHENLRKGRIFDGQIKKLKIGGQVI
jgi:hypothetical protein